MYTSDSDNNGVGGSVGVGNNNMGYKNYNMHDNNNRKVTIYLAKITEHIYSKMSFQNIKRNISNQNNL